MKFEKEARKLYSKLVEDIPLIRLCEYGLWTSEGRKPEEFNWNPVYSRKRKVYPPLSKDGQIKWKEFLIGNWKIFLITLSIVLITIGIIIEYSLNLQTGIACLNRENLLKIALHGKNLSLNFTNFTNLP